MQNYCLIGWVTEEKTKSLFTFSIFYSLFSLSNQLTHISYYLSLSLSGDWNSIPDQVIPKTQKMVLDAFLLDTQHYKVWIKDKWSNPGEGVAPFPRPCCCSYWKGSQWVALYNSWPTYMYIYIYVCVCVSVSVSVCLYVCVCIYKCTHSHTGTSCEKYSLSVWMSSVIFILFDNVLVPLMSMGVTIYQPLRSGRIWHKVNF